ncbi:MAG: PKD domain-containing protein [Candidatus Hydrogenedentes bacterium]|nr:PKD domain-containing protein [Candidatus Hydrogenedentota bacterium]
MILHAVRYGAIEKRLSNSRGKVKLAMQHRRGPYGFAVAILAAMLAGCGPVSGPALSVSPRVVEFGTTKLNEGVRVAAPKPGARLAIQAECDAPWLTVAPAALFSEGPDDAASVVLSVTRTAMRPGRNACHLVFTAPGHADTHVYVSADAIVTADFQASRGAARPGELVVFNDATRVLTGAQPVTAWKWDFGDGASSTEQNPVHAYDDVGSYTVTLSVTSASGTDVRIRKNCIAIKRPALPEADFVAAIRRPVAGTPVQFRDITVPGASPIVNWLWDFGDGASSAEQDPLHLYHTSAVYDVYLTVRNAAGADTALKLGYIDVQPAN